MYTSQSFFYSMVNGISWDFTVLWREWYERHRIFYFMAGNANLFLVRFSIDVNLHIVKTFSHLTVMQHVQIFYLCDEWNERTHYTISYPMITDTMERKFYYFILWNGWKREKSFCPNCRINMHSSFGSRCISRYFYNRFVSKIDISVIRSSIFRIALNRNNIIISWALSFLVSFLINFPTCCTSLPLRFIYMYSGKFILSLFLSLSISLFLQTIDAKVW